MISYVALLIEQGIWRIFVGLCVGRILAHIGLRLNNMAINIHVPEYVERFIRITSLFILNRGLYCRTSENNSDSLLLAGESRQKVAGHADLRLHYETCPIIRRRVVCQMESKLLPKTWDAELSL